MNELPEWILFGRCLSIGFAVAIYIMLWWYALRNLDEPKDFPAVWVTIHVLSIALALGYWIVESWCWG